MELLTLESVVTPRRMAVFSCELCAATTECAGKYKRWEYGWATVEANKRLRVNEEPKAATVDGEKGQHVTLHKGNDGGVETRNALEISLEPRNSATKN